MRASGRSEIASSSVEVGWNMRARSGDIVELLGQVAAKGLGVANSAPARWRWPMSRPDGPMASSNIISMRGTASPANLLVAEAGGYVNDFLRQRRPAQGQFAACLHARGCKRCASGDRALSKASTL